MGDPEDSVKPHSVVEISPEALENPSQLVPNVTLTRSDSSSSASCHSLSPPLIRTKLKRKNSDKAKKDSSSPVSVVLPNDVSDATKTQGKTSTTNTARSCQELESILKTASLSAFGHKNSSFRTSPARTKKAKAKQRQASETKHSTVRPSPSRVQLKPRHTPAAPASPVPANIPSSLLQQKATVHMSEDGAEVTLEPIVAPSITTTTADDDWNDMNGTAPRSPTRRRPTQLELLQAEALTPLRQPKSDTSLPTMGASLLDLDKTPTALSPPRKFTFETTPSPMPTPRRRFCCGVGLGKGCLTTPEDATNHPPPPPPQRNVEDTISVFLGDTSATQSGWCNGWQAWSHFGLLAIQQEHSSTTELKVDIKRVLQNRAGDMNARHRRIRGLKDDLSPFDATPEKTLSSLPRHRSFSFGANNAANGITPRTDHASSVGSVWEGIQMCSEPDNESPFVLRTRGLGSRDNEDLCYDSDPEETTRRPFRSQVRGHSLDTSTELLRELNQGGSFDDVQIENDNVARKLTDFYDEELVKTQVEELMNDAFTLVWHPPSKSDLSNGKPQAVKTWIERGQQLNNRLLIHPKLVWRPLNPRQGIHQTDNVMAELESVELLDIIRVLEVDRIDRKRYPLAKRDCCLLLECLDRTMLFEASSESERNRFVHGLKLLVARFGSKIIVEEHSVFEEFFTLAASEVPGKSPVNAWT